MNTACSRLHSRRYVSDIYFMSHFVQWVVCVGNRTLPGIFPGDSHVQDLTVKAKSCVPRAVTAVLSVTASVKIDT